MARVRFMGFCDRLVIRRFRPSKGPIGGRQSLPTPPDYVFRLKNRCPAAFPNGSSADIIRCGRISIGILRLSPATISQGELLPKSPPVSSRPKNRSGKIDLRAVVFNSICPFFGWILKGAMILYPCQRFPPAAATHRRAAMLLPIIYNQKRRHTNGIHRLNVLMQNTLYHCPPDMNIFAVFP
jgi:hypothetical protein